ncbi:hypothetical protein [Leifsonia sp. NPDC080035]|uniref:Uncharacterized protein n=1 Tax=Leifsonia sp. NPDC080035 TaxID=3143936 RepID=A0AAU7GEX6_9MICO
MKHITHTVRDTWRLVATPLAVFATWGFALILVLFFSHWDNSQYAPTITLKAWLLLGFLVAVLVAIVLARTSTNLTVREIELRTSRFFAALRSLLHTAGFVVVIYTLAAFVASLFIFASVATALWLTLYFFLVFLIDWGLNHSSRDNTPRDLKSIKQEIARCTVDYFSPPSQFKKTNRDGKTEVDEKARLRAASDHIYFIDYVDGGKAIQVAIRNNVVGKTDDDLVKILKTLPNNLGMHALDIEDEDPTPGNVVFTLALEKAVDATKDLQAYRESEGSL